MAEGFASKLELDRNFPARCEITFPCLLKQDNRASPKKQTLAKRSYRLFYVSFEGGSAGNLPDDVLSGVRLGAG